MGGMTLVCADAASAGSAEWLRTGIELRTLDHAAECYRNTHGDWPRTDQRSSWVRKLIDTDLVTHESVYAEYPDADPFIGAMDVWGAPVIYLPPPKGDQNARPIIRSPGRDGIDQLGGGDDLTAGRPVNDGAYWKHRRPAGRRLGLVLGVIGLGIAAALLATSNRWKRAVLRVLMCYIGIALIVTMPMFSLRHNSRLQVSPGWPDHLLLLGWAMVVCAALPPLIAYLLGRVRARRADGTGCARCGYDLTGLPSRRCPECGCFGDSSGVAYAPGHETRSR